MAEPPWLADPYWKLKPTPPTPAEELCACSERTEWLLRGGVGPNPLACGGCNREIVVERSGLSRELADLVGTWQSFFGCFYDLWLDSGEFEAWARQELESPSSPVNRRGLVVRERLSVVAPTFYWWFQDTDSADFVPRDSCPRCQRSLREYRRWLSCSECHIVVAN
jgi:hypothetical protein